MQPQASIFVAAEWDMQDTGTIGIRGTRPQVNALKQSSAPGFRFSPGEIELIFCLRLNLVTIKVLVSERVVGSCMDTC
jgi:hypothetical protein